MSKQFDFRGINRQKWKDSFSITLSRVQFKRVARNFHFYWWRFFIYAWWYCLYGWIVVVRWYSNIYFRTYAVQLVLYFSVSLFMDLIFGLV